MKAKGMSRRDFLITSKDIGKAVGGTILLGSLFGCPNPPIDNGDPATEDEGVAQIESAISSAINEKGYKFKISEYESRHTNKDGIFDRVYDIDTDGNGKYDFVLLCNYVTDGEEVQGLENWDRIKNKEIIKGDFTTNDYIRDQFYSWAKNILG